MSVPRVLSPTRSTDALSETQAAADPVAAPNNVVSLRQVSKVYGEQTAVRSVDLDIRKGEFFTILGPSGSGKTTVLRMIAGLVAPTEGEIIVDGKNVAGVKPYDRDISMVFQSLALFPHMNVASNIGFPLRMRRTGQREIQRRVSEVLEIVRLPQIEGRLVTELSGGQRQRVALARALVYQPTLLLLDEPLGALDRRLREEMQLELARLHREIDVTIMNVTHDQREALMLSDRMAIMDNGSIQQIGSAEELYTEPANPFVATFIGDGVLLTGRGQRGRRPVQAARRRHRRGRGGGPACREHVAHAPQRERQAGGRGTRAARLREPLPRGRRGRDLRGRRELLRGSGAGPAGNPQGHGAALGARPPAGAGRAGLGRLAGGRDPARLVMSAGGSAVEPPLASARDGVPFRWRVLDALVWAFRAIRLHRLGKVAGFVLLLPALLAVGTLAAAIVYLTWKAFHTFDAFLNVQGELSTENFEDALNSSFHRNILVRTIVVSTRGHGDRHRRGAAARVHDGPLALPPGSHDPAHGRLRAVPRR